MIRLERRPLGESEIARLRAASGQEPPAEEPGPSWAGVIFGGAVTALMLVGRAPWYAALPLGALAWRMAVVAGRRRREAAAMFVEASAAIYRRDLEVGEAELMAVEATAAVARPSRSDEPPAFVLDVGGGELLALCDPFLSDAVGEGTFPCARFILVVGPESGALLGLECLGGDLPPAREVDFDLFGSPQVFEGVLAEIGLDEEV